MLNGDDDNDDDDKEDNDDDDDDDDVGSFLTMVWWTNDKRASQNNIRNLRKNVTPSPNIHHQFLSISSMEGLQGLHWSVTNLESLGIEDVDISWNSVSKLDSNDVTDNEVFRFHVDWLSITNCDCKLQSYNTCKNVTVSIDFQINANVTSEFKAHFYLGFHLSPGTIYFFCAGAFDHASKSDFLNETLGHEL